MNKPNCDHLSLLIVSWLNNSGMELFKGLNGESPSERHDQREDWPRSIRGVEECSGVANG